MICIAYKKYVLYPQIRFPVSFQCVDANLSVGRNIRMEDLGKEIRFGWCGWEVFAESKFYAKCTPSVGRSGCNERGLGNLSFLAE